MCHLIAIQKIYFLNNTKIFKHLSKENINVLLIKNVLFLNHLVNSTRKITVSWEVNAEQHDSQIIYLLK